MNVSYKAELWVNKVSVEMNAFAEDFLAHTVVGMVSSLQHVDKIKHLEMHGKKDEVRLHIDGNEIPLTLFPTNIIRNTLAALVSSLKDVDKTIDSWDIRVEA